MRKKFLIGLLIAAGMVFVLNLIHGSGVPLPPAPPPRPQAPAARIVSVDAAPEDISQFPMLKRGVHSIDAVLALIARGWYPDLDSDSLRVVVVEKDFYSYSQYFKNGRMYWSKKKTLVKAGTVLFCDNKGVCVNSVCANELSLTPQTPVEGVGSPLQNWIPDVLAPIDTTSSISGSSPAVPPTEGAPPDYPPYPSGFCCGGGGPGGGSPGSPPTPPISTPEPQSFLLLAVGILILGFVRNL